MQVCRCIGRFRFCLTLGQNPRTFSVGYTLENAPCDAAKRNAIYQFCSIVQPSSLTNNDPEWHHLIEACAQLSVPVAIHVIFRRELKHELREKRKIKFLLPVACEIRKNFPILPFGTVFCSFAATSNVFFCGRTVENLWFF